MTYTSHLIYPALLGAGLASAGILQFDGPISSLLFFGSLMIGALLPDIDHAESALGRRVKPISMIIQALAGHRGITHAPITLLALFVALSAVALIIGSPAQFVVAGICIGYATHLFLDYLTKGGIPAAWPMQSIRTRHSANLFRTGSIGEYALLAGTIGVAVLIALVVR